MRRSGIVPPPGAELVAGEVEVVVIVAVELVAEVVREPAVADRVRDEKGFLGSPSKRTPLSAEAIDMAVVHDADPRPLASAKTIPEPVLASCRPCRVRPCTRQFQQEPSKTIASPEPLRLITVLQPLPTRLTLLLALKTSGSDIAYSPGSRVISPPSAAISPAAATNPAASDTFHTRISLIACHLPDCVFDAGHHLALQIRSGGAHVQRARDDAPGESG